MPRIESSIPASMMDGLLSIRTVANRDSNLSESLCSRDTPCVRAETKWFFVRVRHLGVQKVWAKDIAIIDLISHEIGCSNLSEAILGSAAARTRSTDRRHYDEKVVI